MTLLESMLVNPFASSKPEEHRSQRICDVNSFMDESVMEAFRIYSLNRNTFEDLPRLNPIQIDTVLQMIKSSYDQSEVELPKTGHFISLLLNDMADKGPGRVVLNTGDYMITNLPTAQSDPVKIDLHIAGNAGPRAARTFSGSIFTIEGDAHVNLGYYSRDSVFTVKGNVNDSCGHGIYNCEVTIHGNAARYLGLESRESTFMVHGDIGEEPLVQAIGSTLKTPHRAIYERACNTIRNCYIVLLDKEGQEIERNEPWRRT